MIVATALAITCGFALAAPNQPTPPHVNIGWQLFNTKPRDTTLFLNPHSETLLRLPPLIGALPKSELRLAVLRVARLQAKAAARPASATGQIAVSPIAAEAIGRVAYAEAGNQGAAGIAAVVDTILNRARSPLFGHSIRALLDAPNQFETVTNAGGSWRKLPGLTLLQQVQYRTILGLIEAGGLRDISKGALYFQNTTLEADEAAKGEVSKAMIGFNGARPTTAIGAQTFYHAIPAIIPTGSALAHRNERQRLFVTKTGASVEPAGMFAPINQKMNVTMSHSAAVSAKASKSGPDVAKASASSSDHPGGTSVTSSIPRATAAGERLRSSATNRAEIAASSASSGSIFSFNDAKPVAPSEVP